MIQEYYLQNYKYLWGVPMVCKMPKLSVYGGCKAGANNYSGVVV